MRPFLCNIMRPYARNALNNKTRVFNYRLSRARRIVENAFGILNARFRVYQRPFECKLETVNLIVQTTCLLHNFFGKTGGHSHISHDEITTSLAENENQYLDLQHVGNNPARKASLVRELYCNYFNNVGSVSWQNQVNIVIYFLKYV